MWIVLGDCGDYYCERMHPIAVCSTKARAEELAEAALEMTHSYKFSLRPTSYKSWTSTDVQEITVDQLPWLHRVEG